MKITANVRQMNNASDEMFHCSLSIAKLIEQLGSHQSELRHHSAFDDLIKPIGMVLEKLEADRFRLYQMAQALENIAQTYERTELSVEAVLDGAETAAGWSDLLPSGIDLTSLKENLETILYEGDSHGND